MPASLNFFTSLYSTSFLLQHIPSPFLHQSEVFYIEFRAESLVRCEFVNSSRYSNNLLQNSVKTAFFICNLNQQSEFTFYKLMLWLIQCLDAEKSSGESPVLQIRSIGQFLLSRLFSSRTSRVLRSGFSWVSSGVMFVAFFVVDILNVWYA
jgi:hypothetical protein